MVLRFPEGQEHKRRMGVLRHSRRIYTEMGLADSSPIIASETINYSFPSLERAWEYVAQIRDKLFERPTAYTVLLETENRMILMAADQLAQADPVCWLEARKIAYDTAGIGVRKIGGRTQIFLAVSFTSATDAMLFKLKWGGE